MRLRACRFLQMPVKGLFFLPMHRRCLTSFSVWKGWRHYMKVRHRDINVEASSTRTYFGLNALFFAVRCASALLLAGASRETIRDIAASASSALRLGDVAVFWSAAVRPLCCAALYMCLWGGALSLPHNSSKSNCWRPTRDANFSAPELSHASALRPCCSVACGMTRLLPQPGRRLDLQPHLLRD
jgi:hypothetical protein